MNETEKNWREIPLQNWREIPLQNCLSKLLKNIRSGGLSRIATKKSNIRSGSTHFGFLHLLLSLQQDMPLGRVVVLQVGLHVGGVAINPRDDLLAVIAGGSLKLPDVRIQIGILCPAFSQGEVVPQR